MQPRYQPAGGETFCATAFMDAAHSLAITPPLPFWGSNGGIGKLVNPIGDPPASPVCRLQANDLVNWLHGTDGPAFGWLKTNMDNAQARACQGFPSIATYQNPNGHGHVAWIEAVAGNEPYLAQAGARCGYGIPFSSVFGQLEVEFWTHS